MVVRLAAGSSAPAAGPMPRRARQRRLCRAPGGACTPDWSRRISHSPAPAGASVACTCSDWPSSSAASRRSGSPSSGPDRSISHSSMPSAAMSASMTGALPAAICASARCTAVSCAIRRAQNGAGRWRPNAHTRSCPAARTASTTRSAPACSQPTCSAGSSGIRPSGTLRNGMNSAERVLTISAAQRWARPTCVASCRRVQSGQVGTGRVRSAPSISSAMIWVLAVSSA